MSQLQVELVAADRKVWEGEATQVSARSIDGDLGILPGHTPILCVLAEGEVRVNTGGSWRSATVDGGFLSVANNQVRLLCEYAELSHESNYDEAKRLLEERKARDESDAAAS